MSEDKPYRLGPLSPSPRRASPTYEQPNPRAPSQVVKVVPGFEQTNAPLGSTELPPMVRAPVTPPFRVR